MAKKKTVLLVRNIHLGAFGGAETYQVMLAKCLQENGLNPVIISSSKPLRDYAKKQHISARRSLYLPAQNWSGIRNLFLPLYFIWQFLLFLWYLGIILVFRPKALQLQSRDDFIAGTLAGKLLRRRVIWTDHSDLRLVVWQNINQKYKNPIGKLILKLAKLPDCITTISDYEYQYIKKLIAPRKLDNLKVVKNGVVDQFSRYQATAPNKRSVCFVGRLEDYKGVAELAEAFATVVKSLPEAELHFYGDGPMKDYLKNQKIKHLCVHGHTNQPLDAISKSSIFVLPSYREGLSLSLIDAAMMERAIIATNIDGNPEIVVDHQTGLLVPPRDAEALANALGKILQDDALRNELATNARKHYLKNFNFEEIVKEQLLPLYCL